MKVAELEIGMVLRPSDIKYQFRTSYGGDWVNVVPIRNVRSVLQPNTRILPSGKQKVAVYLGRKKDIANESIKWSDRFVLFENKILAVDPSAWRLIESITGLQE